MNCICVRKSNVPLLDDECAGWVSDDDCKKAAAVGGQTVNVYTTSGLLACCVSDIKSASHNFLQ